MPQLEQLIRKATKVAADADGKARKVQARAAAGYLYAYQQAKQQHSSTAAQQQQQQAHQCNIWHLPQCSSRRSTAVEAGVGLLKLVWGTPVAAYTIVGNS